MSMTTLIAGNPISPEALANMPPEKRAKVEEAMNWLGASCAGIKDDD
jgi:hypothetical protein